MAVAKQVKPTPVVIERKGGKLFHPKRQLRFGVIFIWVVIALLIGAVLALGLKRILIIDAGERAPAVVSTPLLTR
jgi:hypothetical protein